MRKKIVAIDMDDTICHLVPKAIHYHNLQYPDRPLTMEKMTSFDMTKIWHPDCNEDIFFGRPGLYEELEIFDEHTVEEVRKIASEHDVIIVTAARPSAVPEKWNWLQRHMPFIPYENFFIARRKSLVNFDLLIDDGPHNLLPAMEAGKLTIGIPRPWNTPIQDLFLMKDSWDGMSKLVNRLLAEGS
ncbi:hypothetical protein NYE69_08545 [Paenibacillus sp. FSL R5-0527]|uniref:5' nucleotidase, NT5C type n=1 Tax=Paenibacillus sp. FSL R5-0527 TaxID=2975321 RepID=UPI00097B0488|nr:hypothetical protein BK140_25485 [Paenibacillus macerans]